MGGGGGHTDPTWINYVQKAQPKSYKVKRWLIHRN